MFARTLVIWLIAAVALPTGEPFWDHFLRVADAGGGRLLLILLDVNGDGRKEIFLSGSIPRRSRFLAEWVPVHPEHSYAH